MRWVRLAFVVCVVGGLVQTGRLTVPAAIADPVTAQYREWRGHQDEEAKQVGCRIHVLRADRGDHRSTGRAEECVRMHGRANRYDDDE